ncbi:MAG: fructose-bisphosphate aldolase class I [Gammaproteobacteria bacterium]|nr:fructose-bisphosphate aldolase class I [Gammaproteobacteria bacterium]MBU6508569.1 fructose-bisphosphate aldolase class I [Gammaproteobacteria bacterium]MDE1983304.1 fructose-bisphosphate aldolase class I [Gammaproteobacteria bacterium]MDE2107867.1 fructose-bisphosphate aldolase class I [Gammaproteobacteria bacterium]
MNLKELTATAERMVAGHRGLLAADESTGTIEKRFKVVGVASSEEARRAYREMLFTTPGMEKFISGVIMYDETIRQKTRDGAMFSEFLTKLGVIPGIKVDKGTKPLANSPDEKITEGLDGLRERLQEYYKLGARFAKWRAVIDIGPDIPTYYCLRANAQALARYAALCQEAGLAPIVEPEVLMDGAHDIERCVAVTRTTLKIVFDELYIHRVALEGMILKPNMLVSGMKCPRQAGIEEVARETLRILKECVPAAVPGIMFLSGGQSAELATAHLNAINALGPAPWKLSFSYGRALQAPSLDAWKGQAANLAAGQQAFFRRSRMNSAACAGDYTPQMEKAA